MIARGALRSIGLAVAAVAFGAATLAGCDGRAPAAPSDRLNLFVSIPPQKHFVERVGGEQVRVSVMVEPGSNPATYEPKPEQLKRLSEAEAYFSIGVPFERAWLSHIAAANEEMLIVDTAEGIERMPMATQRHGGENSDGEPQNADPHIWLSPALVKIQARTIYEALAQIDPKHEQVYEANLETFIGDIDALDAEIRERLEGADNRKFMVFHPSWGYFAQDYGLEMLPIEVGGQEPSAAELAALISKAREEEIKVVFAQPEFSTRDAETIAHEIGGQVLLISPLAENWEDNLRQVAETLAEVLGQ